MVVVVVVVMMWLRVMMPPGVFFISALEQTAWPEGSEPDTNAREEQRRHAAQTFVSHFKGLTCLSSLCMEVTGRMTVTVK